MKDGTKKQTQNDSFYDKDIDYVDRYNNCLGKLLRLDQCSLQLMKYFTDNIEDNKLVYNTKTTREYIIDYFKNKGIIYKEDTISKAFQKLTYTGLLITTTRSTYKVNPNFYVKSTTSDGVIQITILFDKHKDTMFKVSY